MRDVGNFIEILWEEAEETDQNNLSFYSCMNRLRSYFTLIRSNAFLGNASFWHLNDK